MSAAPAADSAELAIGPPDRRATWLELFYDLVYVIAVSRCAALLHHDPSWGGVALFSGLFLIVWWGWVGNAIFLSRFYLHDRWQLLLTLGQMLAVAALAVQLDPAMNDGGVILALSYIAIRCFLLLFYARAWRRFERARPFIQHTMAGFALGSVGCWTLSLFVPPPFRYGLWALGLAIDLLTPLVGVRHMWRPRAHTAHLPERYGLFALIVLGEGLLGVVNGLDAVHWQAEGTAVSVFGFVIACAIWWIYFDYVEHAPVQCHLGSGRLYTYCHYPLTYGLAMAAVGGGLALQAGAEAHLPPLTIALLAGGLACFTLAFFLIQLVTYAKAERKRWVSGFSVMLLYLACFVLFANRLSPIEAVAALALAMVALTTWSVRRRAHWPPSHR